MVNLEDWVGQEVLVTYEDGTQGVGKIIRNFNIQTNFDYLFLYLDNRRGWESYTKDGFKWHSKCSSWNNIIKIQPMNKKEQLKQQIKALEAELKNLEAADKVPEGFNEEKAYQFLVNGKIDLGAYRWGQNTQKGQKYWVDISIRNTEPTDKDVIQLQKWIIESYRGKLGLS